MLNFETPEVRLKQKIYLDKIKIISLKCFRFPIERVFC